MIKVDNIVLPLPCNFCLKLEENLNIDSNLLGDEFAIGFTLSDSPNVNRLFKKYGTNVRIPAELTEYNNFEYDFVFDRLKKKKYSARLVKKKDTWLQCIDETKICDLELGTTEHTESNVIDFINGTGGYNSTGEYDGTFSTAPILGNFGNQGEKWLMKDIRYAFSPLDILKKGFKKCKIDFVSPVMESDPHLWSYLLKKNWWENSGNGTLINAEASLTVDTNITAINVPSDNIVSDAGGNADVTAGYLVYTNNYGEDITVCICVEGTLVNNSNAPATILIQALYQTPGTGGFLFDKQQRITIGANTQKKVCFCSVGVLPNGDNLRINNNVITANSDLTWLAGQTVKVIGKDKNFYKGDMLNNAEMLDCNLTVLDVLKMSKHLYNGFIDYDRTNRTFFMSSPYLSDGTESFYRPANKTYDLTHMLSRVKVICDSRGIDGIIEEANERIYKFKDSNDEYISQQIEEGNRINIYCEPNEDAGNRTDLEGEYGVLSSFNTLGLDNTKKKESENHLAEPTLNNFGGIFQGGVNLSQLEESIYIPQFLDNTDGKQSNCINPRVFYLYNGGQEVNGIDQTIYFENNILSRYPNIYQELPDNVDILGNANFDRRQLTYTEIYKKYYKRFEQRFILGAKESYCLLIGYKDYKALSFRNKVCIRYEGQDRTYLLTSKRFNSCGKVVEFKFIRENLSC